MFRLKTLQRNKTVKYGIPMLATAGRRRFLRSAGVHSNPIRCPEEQEEDGSFTGGPSERPEAGGHPGGGVPEDEGAESGRVEEHSRSSSLGGLQRLPGDTAQKGLRTGV